MTTRPDDQSRTEHSHDFIKVCLVEVIVGEFPCVPLSRPPTPTHEHLARANGIDVADTKENECNHPEPESRAQLRMPPQVQQWQKRHHRAHETTALAMKARVDEARDEAGEESAREAQPQPATPVLITTVHGPSIYAKIACRTTLILTKKSQKSTFNKKTPS